MLVVHQHVWHKFFYLNQFALAQQLIKLTARKFTFTCKKYIFVKKKMLNTAPWGPLLHGQGEMGGAWKHNGHMTTNVFRWLDAGGVSHYPTLPYNSSETIPVCRPGTDGGVVHGVEQRTRTRKRKTIIFPNWICWREELFLLLQKLKLIPVFKLTQSLLFCFIWSDRRVLKYTGLA